MANDRATVVVDESFVADDVAAAEQLLARVSTRAVIREGRDPFDFRQRTVGDGRLTMTSFEISSFLHVEVDIEGAVGVARRRGGRLRTRSNGEDVDASHPFLLRPGRAEAWSTALEADVVGLDLPALGAFVGSGDTSLRSAGTGALTPALQRHWDLTVSHVQQVFAEPDLLHNDLIRQAAIDAVFAATLSTFGIEAEHERDQAAGPDAVRRATSYIDDHLGEPLSVGDIARAARLSVRGLQSAFARSLGTTPAAYVRRARLSAVRSDLLGADAEEATVSAIARRWGFAHLPRFAQHYRAAFGEQPSETLRGRGGQSQPR